MENKGESSLKDNCYAGVEVEVFYGEEFEKAYNDYLDRRVAMAMRHVAEYVEAEGDVNALMKRLQETDDA